MHFAFCIIIYFADVAELADALVSGSSEAIHVGSSPVVRTKKYCRKGYIFCSIFLSKSQTLVYH